MDCARRRWWSQVQYVSSQCFISAQLTTDPSHDLIRSALHVESYSFVSSHRMYWDRPLPFNRLQEMATRLVCLTTLLCQGICREGRVRPDKDRCRSSAPSFHSRQSRTILSPDRNDKGACIPTQTIVVNQRCGLGIRAFCVLNASHIVSLVDSTVSFHLSNPL
jgi:hypothetical protein